MKQDPTIRDKKYNRCRLCLKLVDICNKKSSTGVTSDSWKQ